jgi:hypothetical protein
MTKTEKVVLQGIRNSLDKIRNSEDGDSWERYGNRMRTTVHSAVDVLDQILTLDGEEEEEEEGIKLSL